MIINGRKIASEILQELKPKLANKSLRLAAILVGDDPDLEKFVEAKAKAAQEIGVEFSIYQFPKEIDTDELIKRIKEISAITDGALVELPLPAHIDRQAVLDAIPVEKDVDVLSGQAQRSYFENKSPINPPSVEALKIVLEKNNIDVKGKKACIFGHGFLIGKPIKHWLELNGAQVSVVEIDTKDPKQVSKEADIIISGVGKPGLVRSDMVKDGAVVIDFGYGKKDGKMVGDVDFNSVAPKASLITPVPGGMGPILVATVLKNLIALNQK